MNCKDKQAGLIDVSKILVGYRPVQTVINTAVTPNGTILKQNPTRWGFIVDCDSIVQLTISTNPNPATGEGLGVSFARCPLFVIPTIWGPFCQMQWYYVGTGFGTFTIFEIIKD